MNFWHIMQHYITKYKYLVGLCGTSTHISDATKFHIKKHSATLDDLIIATIKGDALSMFRNTDN